MFVGRISKEAFRVKHLPNKYQRELLTKMLHFLNRKEDSNLNKAILVSEHVILMPLISDTDQTASCFM